MTCVWCRENDATEEHHCLIGRDKNNPELDDPKNKAPVCWKCHRKWVGTGGRLVRESFWKIQCERFGEAEMQEYYSSLSLKTKERYW